MKPEEIGEFGLIDLIRKTGVRKDSVVFGIGDDCAVLRKNEKEYTIVSCDLLTEGVHFKREWMKPEDIGYKAVAVNLSDIAAMGGIPEAILIAIALPEDLPVEDWQRFYKGVDGICKRFEVALVGGDTTKSLDSLSVNVTVLGRVETDRIHYRSDAKAGDVLFVTGPLGASKAGLELFLKKITVRETADREYLIKKHCRPVPRCREVRILSCLADSGLHALDDISDGLFSECREIAEASGKRLVIQKSAVPVDGVVRKISLQNGTDGFSWAVSGGEDFELVGTMDPDTFIQIRDAYEAESGEKLYKIGYVEEGKDVFLVDDDHMDSVNQYGYNHFSEKSGNAVNCKQDKLESENIL